jgi:hypothetical protein
MVRVALVCMAVLLATPIGAAGQRVRGIGVVGGSTESRLVHARDGESARRTDLVAGAFLDVDLPSSRWSVLGELTLARRGGTFPEAEVGAAGEVQADYVDFTLAPSFHLDIGFVGAYAYGGPTLEMSVRTRYTSGLAAAFSDPKAQVFGVTGGGGIELRLLTAYAFRLELRHMEGLSPSFSGDLGEYRNRSTEILVRVARRGS